MANDEIHSDDIGVEFAISMFMLFLMAKDNPRHSNGLILLSLILGVGALFRLGIVSGKIATTKGQETNSHYLYYVLAYCALILWFWLS